MTVIAVQEMSFQVAQVGISVLKAEASVLEYLKHVKDIFLVNCQPICMSNAMHIYDLFIFSFISRRKCDSSSLWFISVICPTRSLSTLSTLTMAFTSSSAY